MQIKSQSIVAQADSEQAHSILVAEDDHDFRALLVCALRREGYHVTPVEAGAPLVDALHRALDSGADVPSLVVSDDRMPGMRGLHAFRHARHQGWTAPLVLITAFGDDELVAEAAEASVVVMDKPFEMGDLRMVARFLTTPSSRTPDMRVCRACGRLAWARWVADSVVLVLCMKCREVRGFRS